VSPDPPHPTPERHNGLEKLLREAPVAHLGLVEGPPSGETASRPYVVPVNFAYVGSPFAGEQSKPSPTPGGAPGQETQAPPEPANDRPFPRLFLHTGVGRKTRALAKNPHVCVAVTSDVSFSAGLRPCEDGFDYRSALVWGRARLLESREDRLAALGAIVAKYDPQAVGRPFDERDFAQTQVYEVSVDTVSYKERPRPA
jgi:nitroimidazol reductase NimA-like FMN-containing flavoprotein (pyridoxamine 5'-phosphate oxidase superfamily)